MSPVNPHAHLTKRAAANAARGNVVETVNVMRQDRAQAGWNRDELLKNVPETEDGFIKVPAIIDNGEAGA